VRAWIRTIDEDEAQSELKTQYGDVERRRGRVSNVMKIHSLDPEAMRLHLDLYVHLMFGKSALTRAQREMIAVAVSRGNGCAYCATHHGEALLAHVHDEALLENLKKGFESSSLTSKDRTMLRYAVKLTKTPVEVVESDIESLRQAGFADEDILRINLITSYFNFANRIVSGLGVPLEAAQERVYNY
jgi:uncharacterized peroxidase-related enzyme